MIRPCSRGISPLIGTGTPLFFGVAVPQETEFPESGGLAASATGRPGEGSHGGLKRGGGRGRKEARRRRPIPVQSAAFPLQSSSVLFGPPCEILGSPMEISAKRVFSVHKPEACYNPSRWLSPRRATPPEKISKRKYPGRAATSVRLLPGAGAEKIDYRWCRFAQPPARIV